MKKHLQKWRVSIRFTVVSIFIFATALTAAVAIGLQYHFSQKMATDHALEQFQLSASHTAGYLSSIDQRASQTARTLSRFPKLVENNWVHPDTRKLFAEVMRNHPVFYAIYIGFPNGDFYELINLNTHPKVRKQLKATPLDRWAVLSVKQQNGQRRRETVYFDQSFKLRDTRRETTDYDASKRHWFTQAKLDQVHKTRPYQFQHLQAPGQTYSTVIPSTQAVLAVDITLSSLSEHLTSLPLSSKSDIFIYENSGEVIASNHIRSNKRLPDSPPMKLTTEEQSLIESIGTLRVSNETDWPPIDYAQGGEPKGYAIDLIKLVTQNLGLRVEFINGYSWPELVKRFEQKELEILQPVYHNAINAQRGNLSAPLMKLPYAIATQPDKPEITHLSELAGKTLAIPDGWTIVPVIKQYYPEIEVLTVSNTHEALQAVINKKAYATLDMAMILRYTADQFFIEGLRYHENLQQLQAILPDTLHLLTQHDQKALLTILNKALNHITPEQKRVLQNKWFNTENNGSVPQAPIVPYRELIEAAQDTTQQNRLISGVINQKPHYLFVTPVQDGGDTQEYFAVAIPKHTVLASSLSKVKYSLLTTAAFLVLLLPVSWLFASPIVAPIRRLAEQNRKIEKRQYDEVKMCDSAIKEIYDLSISMVDMTAAIQKYENEQKTLMDSFIRLIAQAIDEKSPYTGKHCERVPELSMMLAKAADHSTDKPFEAFSFHSDEELREFRIAAWLHDCGKITIPEHIVDKGTKLETIYNRIHEIRMRFEVLWRDAEIEYLKNLAEMPHKSKELKAKLFDQRQTLTDDFAFVAHLNLGREPLSYRDIERLHALANITWQRHFNQHLGLSPVEEQRFPKQAETLPVTEPLLSDKPEHLIEREHPIKFDPKLGIKMKVPEHLYNLGELHNLSVPAGTLSPEDRFKINEHIISTITMLNNLPFPDELASVPKLASTHHETLNGEGYPRKLTAKDLSLPERIIAIADIFEALTAADRPYKKAKTVRQAVEILHQMVEENRLDRDVFELFLTSGVYLDYAKHFLKDEQLDSIDLSLYVRETDTKKPNTH